MNVNILGALSNRLPSFELFNELRIYSAMQWRLFEYDKVGAYVTPFTSRYARRQRKREQMNKSDEIIINDSYCGVMTVRFRFAKRKMH